MKCLSLWQPWATLMAVGAKRNETRSWATSYRGPLAIHAAKKWNNELSLMCGREPFREALVRQCDGMIWLAEALRALPFGAIVAVVGLVDCIEISPTNAPTGDERSFGDYTPGRFMWKTVDLRRLPSPVPYAGHQGLFDLPDEIVAAETVAGGAT